MIFVEITEIDLLIGKIYNERTSLVSDEYFSFKYFLKFDFVRYSQNVCFQPAGSAQGLMVSCDTYWLNADILPCTISTTKITKSIILEIPV